MSQIRVGVLMLFSLAFGAPRFETGRGPSAAEWVVREGGADTTAQPSFGATQIRVHLRTPPDSAYGIVARLLIARGYQVREGVANALSTGDHYLAGVGMVRLTARVMPDSLGARVDVSGEWRRLRRLLIVSAMAKDSVVIAAGAGGSRGAQAWQELTTIAEELGGVVTYAPAIGR
jgi:hypothetical protein